MDLRTLPKVVIYESELDFIARCVTDYPYSETGGDFFGLWTNDGYPFIHYVIGPGENTRRTASSFYQDINYLKECGFLLHDRYNLEHIGAWHSHHQLDLSEPSKGDVNTMSNALDEDGLSRFILSICNIEDEKVTVNGYLFSYDNLHHYAYCNWHILEGKSPIRESLEKKEESLLGLFINPDTEKADYRINRIEEPDIKEPERQVVEKDIVEKPVFPGNSYWNQREGQKYLKDVFEHMKDREDLYDVELLQLTDKRVAISFKHEGKSYEMRFPNNFPKKDAEIVEKMSVNDIMKIVLRPVRKQKSGLRKFLNTMNIFKQ